MSTLFIVYTNNSTLNQELNLVEQEAIAGLDIVRAILNRFPDNAILIQFFCLFEQYYVSGRHR